MSSLAAVVAFMALVVIQCFTVLTARMNAESKTAFSPFSAILAAEICKFVMSYVAVEAESGRKAVQQLRSAVTRKVVVTTLFLGVLYAVNNRLTFLISKTADPASLTLCKAASILATPLLLAMTGPVALTFAQYFSALFVVSGLIGVQWDPCTSSPILSQQTYLLLALSVFLSSLGGVVNSRFVKSASESVAVTNCFLYAAGIVCNGVGFILYDGGDVGQLARLLTPAGVAAILSNSLIGIAINLVYKHGDAVLKSFSGAVASAVLSLVSFLFFGLEPTVIRVSGIVIVAVAVFQYSAPASLVASKADLPTRPLAIVLSVAAAYVVATRSMATTDDLVP